jgi:hypothetical protein
MRQCRGDTQELILKSSELLCLEMIHATVGWKGIFEEHGDVSADPNRLVLMKFYCLLNETRFCDQIKYSDPTQRDRELTLRVGFWKRPRG